MVYESDFYTTRRPYRAPNPSYSSYTASKREIPWEKVPFVPRPSLVPDPVTAFGKRPSLREQSSVPEKLIIAPLKRASIRPSILPPPKPYINPRDVTRDHVLDIIRKKDLVPKHLPASDAMDVVLPRLHKAQPAPAYRRRLVYSKVYP